MENHDRMYKVTNMAYLKKKGATAEQVKNNQAFAESMTECISVFLWGLSVNMGGSID